MRHLRKFNESDNSFKNTNEDIELFFTDYTDENPNALNIEDVLVNLETKRVINETPYMKDVSNFRRAKMITLKVSEADGLFINSYGKCLTSFEMLDDIVADIKRFYVLSGEEVNYTINMEFGKLVITFITLGDNIKPEESQVGKIDKYLSELKEILKGRGYKRINDKGNWLEIKTPKRGPSRYGDQSFDLRDLVRKVLQNQITLDNVNPDDKNKIELINWKNKVTQDGFDIKISGGDHQAIFQLKRQ